MAGRLLVIPKENIGVHHPTLSQKAAANSATRPLAQRDSGAEPASGLLSLQHTIGNRAVQRLIQTKKLSVGPAHDRYEDEADRVANQVAAGGPAPGATTVDLQRKTLGQAITPLVRRQKSNKDEDRITRKVTDSAADRGGFSIGGGFSRRLAQNFGGGSRLPADTRVEMESKFGVNFEPVRVHTGSEATRLTRSLNAEAFTSGRDIFVEGGRYQPHSAKGKHLLAHELTHVVQQANGAQHNSAGVELGGDRVADQLSRKRIYRQFDFLKIRRKNARTVKKALEQMRMVDKDTGDPYGHWWAELGDTRDGWRARESYGMWPAKGPDADTLGAGVAGRANAMGKIPKGRRERDPLHGEKTDDEFHPVVEVDADVKYEKAEEDYGKQIKAYAHGYKDKWKWRSRWSVNGQKFQTSLMRKLRMEIPRKKMPMLLNPRVMLSREAQENMETAAEFERTQAAFAKWADRGGLSLDKLFSEGGLAAEDFQRAFDVTPQEQEARAHLLAQLNPQVTIEQLLKASRG